MNIDELFYLKKAINVFRELKRVKDLYDEYVEVDSMFPPEDEIYGKEVYTLRRIKEDSKPKAKDLGDFIQSRIPELKKRKLSVYMSSSKYNENDVRTLCKLEKVLKRAHNLEDMIYEYVDAKSIALQNKQKYEEELKKNGRQ